MHGYFVHHEKTEVARIHAMLELFASEQCLSHRLAQYFGDDRAPERCGHCSVCEGHVAVLPEPPALTPLSEQNFADLCSDFVGRHLEVRGHEPGAECLTRFLCGISVPMFTRLKARNIGGFAALEAYPYAEVRQWIQRQIQ